MIYHQCLLIIGNCLFKIFILFFCLCSLAIKSSQSLLLNIRIFFRLNNLLINFNDLIFISIFLILSFPSTLVEIFPVVDRLLTLTQIITPVQVLCLLTENFRDLALLVVFDRRLLR